METLIVVRHGDYNHNGLSNYGREQISSLSNKLKPFINNAPHLILSSTATRAIESAEIIAKIFNAPYEEHEILWSESRHPEDFPGTLELIRSRKHEIKVITLVTHYEYVESFPEYFAKKELDAKLYSHLIGKGEAWAIECNNKTIQHIVY